MRAYAITQQTLYKTITYVKHPSFLSSATFQRNNYYNSIFFHVSPQQMSPYSLFYGRRSHIITIYSAKVSICIFK